MPANDASSARASSPPAARPSAGPSSRPPSRSAARPVARAPVPPAAYSREAFLAAYDEVLAACWPPGTEGVTVETPYGLTHVNSHGPADGPPVVLLHGGGGVTSTVWSATAAALGGTYRVHAVDTMGEAGRSVPGARPIRRVEDQSAWLGAVLDGLGTGPVALCGHSYGAWTAAHHALRAPEQVRSLVLVEPTNCFTGFSARYLARALPMLLRPTVRSRRRFLAWETGGLVPEVPEEPWGHLYDLAAGFPAARPLTGPRPAARAWSASRMPVLVVLAGRGRAHDAGKVAGVVRRVLPRARTLVLPEATHHTLPLAGAEEMNRHLSGFLAEHGHPGAP